MNDIDLVKRAKHIIENGGLLARDTVLAMIEQLEAAQHEHDNWRVSFDNERFRADKLWAELERRDDAVPNVPMRNPVLGYADSYRSMAACGVENIPIWSVITDLERNIAPLCAAAPATATEKVVKLPPKVNGESVEYGGSGAFTMGKRCGINEGIVRCAAALDAAGVKWVEGE